MHCFCHLSTCQFSSISVSRGVYYKNSERAFPVVTPESAPLNEQKENGLARFQQYEWQPMSLQTYGHARTIKEAKDAILLNRGRTADEIQSFKESRLPTAEEIGLDILALRHAGELMKKAAEENQRVLVYGDEDADGVVSTYVLYKMLQAFGVNDITPYAASRDEHGYGFTEYVAEQAGGKYDLIVTIDHGITNKEEVATAVAKGSEVIVIDHHRIQEGRVPDQATVLHSTETSAAGLAYLLSKHYEVEEGIKLSEDVSDIVAIAVVADMMPMTRTNYPLVRDGLKTLRHTKRKSLQVLAETMNKDLTTMTEKDISFDIAPLFNMWGKYGEANKMLQLLRSHERDVVLDIALKQGEKITTRNDFQSFSDRVIRSRVRQTVEKKKEMKDKANEVIEKIHKDIEEIDPDGKFVFYINNDPEVPAGIVNTSRIARMFNKPAIIGHETSTADYGDIINFDMRSFDGIVNFLPLIETLHAQELLIEGGGHPDAGGFAIYGKDLARVEAVCREYMEQSIESLPLPVKDVDCEVPLELVSQLNSWQREIRPFGFRNEQPILMTRDLIVSEVFLMPKDKEEKKHIRLTLSDGNSNAQLKGIMFNAPEEQLQVQPGERLDVLFTTEDNHWKGRSSLQLNLLDFREAEEGVAIRPIPALPKREPAGNFLLSHAEPLPITDEIAEALERGVKRVGFDMDDTLKIPDPVTTAIRYACMEAYKHSDDQYFKTTYGQIRKGEKSWEELYDRLRALSQELYGDPEKIIQNGLSYTTAWRLDHERGELYKNALGFTTTDEVWEFQRQFQRGRKFKRRKDEFTYPAPGAIGLLNFLTEEVGSEVSLISNSEASLMIDFEEQLRHEGFKGRFTHKISAGSLNRRKPDPYSLRNLLSHTNSPEESGMLYVGNTIQDIEYTYNLFDTDNFPSPHTLDLSNISILPVLITRGADYSEFGALPPHAQFMTLTDMETSMRDILGIHKKAPEQVVWTEKKVEDVVPKSKVIELYNAKQQVTH